MEHAPERSDSVVRTGSGLRIRPYRTDDVDPLYEAVRESIRQLSPWLAWAQGGYERSDAQAWVQSRAAAWERAEAYSFAIERCSDESFLGGVGLNQVQEHARIANLGFWVRSAATGQGVATASARLAARFGFEDLALQRIELTVPVGHAASARVAEKVGARREAILRNRLRLHDEPVAAILFGLLPSDILDCTA